MCLPGAAANIELVIGTFGKHGEYFNVKDCVLTTSDFQFIFEHFSVV
jgi:hypothetical protein